MLQHLDKSQQEIAPLLDQASARLDRSVARASTFALGIGLALIVAATGAAILVRRIPRASRIPRAPKDAWRVSNQARRRLR